MIMFRLTVLLICVIDVLLQVLLSPFPSLLSRRVLKIRPSQFLSPVDCLSLGSSGALAVAQWGRTRCFVCRNPGEQQLVNTVLSFLDLDRRRSDLV